MSTMGDSPDESDDDIAQIHIHLPWVPSARTAASPFLAAAELTGIKRRWSKSDRCCIHHMPSPYEPESRDSSVPSIGQTTSYGTPAGTDAPVPSIGQTTSYGTPAGTDAPVPSIGQTTSYGTPAGTDAPVPSIGQTTSDGTPAGTDAPVPSFYQTTSDGTPAGRDAPVPSIDQTTSHGAPAGRDSPVPSIGQTTSDGTPAGRDTPIPSIGQTTSDGTPAGTDASVPSIGQTTSDGTLAGTDAPVPSIGQTTSDGTPAGRDSPVPSIGQTTSDGTPAGTDAPVPSFYQTTSHGAPAGRDPPVPSIGQTTSDGTPAGTDTPIPSFYQTTSHGAPAGRDSPVPSIDQTTSDGAPAGRDAPVTSIDQTTSHGVSAGTDALVPSIDQTTSHGASAGRDALVPSIDQTTSHGAPAGRDALVPSIDQTTSHGAPAGRDALVPSIDQTTSHGAPAGRDALVPSIDQTTSHGAPAGRDAPVPSIDQTMSYGTPAGTDAPVPSIGQTTSYGTPAGTDALVPSIGQTTSYGTPAGTDAPVPSIGQTTSDGTPAGTDAPVPSIDQTTSHGAPAGRDSPVPSIGQTTSDGTPAGTDTPIPSIGQTTSDGTPAGTDAPVPSIGQTTSDGTPAGTDAPVPSFYQTTSHGAPAGRDSPVPSIGQTTSDGTPAGTDTPIPSFYQTTSHGAPAGRDAPVPSIDQTTSDGTPAGRDAPVPSIDQTTSHGVSAGTDALVPSIDQTTSHGASAGRDALVPSIDQTTSHGAPAGRDALVPSIDQTTSHGAPAGRDALVPSIDQTTSHGAPAGRDALVPSIDQTTSQGAPAGRDAPVPSIDQTMSYGTPAGRDALVPSIDQTTSHGAPAGRDAPAPSIDQTTSHGAPAGRDAPVPSIDQTMSYGTPAGRDALVPSIDQTTSHGAPAGRDALVPSIDQTTLDGAPAVRDSPVPSIDQTTSYGTPAVRDAPESSVDQTISYGMPAERDAPESSVDQTTSYGTPAVKDAPKSSVDQTTSYGTPAERDAPKSSVDQTTSHGAPAGRAASDSYVDQQTSYATPVDGDGPLLPVQNTSHGTTEDTHPPRRRETPDAGAMSHKGWMSHATDQDVVATPSQEQGLTVNVYNITNSEGIHVTQERIVSKGRLFKPDVSPSAEPVGHDMTTRWNQKDNPSVQSKTDTYMPHCSNSKSQLKGQQIHQAKEEDTSRSPKLKRISDRTQQLLLLTDKELFTPTKALGIAKQFLLELGVVLVTGRSGDGKTTLCYRVLKDIANIQHRTPLIITTADDWKYIPPPRYLNNISEDEKYVVFIDDIFGRTNLSREDLRMWERELPIMWPSVESGQVFLLLASRGNIYKQCQQGLKMYKIFSALKEVGLNTDIYGLNVKEKIEMLEAYLNRRTALKMTYDEMRQAVKTSNELGFPQICRFYISSREAQKRGVEFFSRPLQYLMDEVNTLREFDPQAYGVLLLLAFEEGVIKQSHVDPFSSKCGPLIKNWELIRSLCNISPEFGLGDVCNVAKRLCGMYLSFVGGYYRFSHQSIHETIVLEFTSKYPGKGIEIAPINILVEFVRTAECEDKTATSILLSEDYYKDFAVRIIQLLKSRNSEKVMDHSVLRNDTFLRYFHSALSEDDLKTLCSTTVPSTYTNIGAYSVFSNDYITANYQDKLEYVISEMQAIQLPVPELYITSVLFAKGLQSIATMLTPSSFLGCGIDMNMFLASSAFVGDLPTVERLLDSGIVPNETCVLAALLSLGDNENVLRKILCHHQAPLLDANMLLFSLKFAVHCNRVNTLKVIMKSIVNHQAKEKMVDIVAKLFFVQMSAVHGCVPLNLPVTVASEHEHKSSVDTFHVLVAADAALDFPKCLSFVSQTTDIELLESITCEIRKREKGSLQYQIFYDRHYDLETDCSATSSPATCPEFHLKSLINSKDKYGCTPLHNAAYESSAECVLFLLNNGANPNSETITLETPLHEAARTKKDRLSKMQSLFDAGADVNAADIGGCTPLHSLALKGNLAEFQYLLLKGAKMNADSLGQTPLHRAASAYTVYNTVIQLLVENIGDINHSDYYGCTPLIYIAGKGSFATLKHAIEKGADVKAKTRMGKTALHESVLSSIESVRKAELLLQHGCGINEISEEGFTPLLCAAQQGTFESLKLLVDNQSDVSVKDKQGQTALHLIPHYSIDEAKKISYLLKAGADINAVDDKGATPLHVAAAEGCLASVEPLVKYKADINSRDTDGLTILHRAAQSLTDSEAIIELLIAKGANVNMRDNSGLTALCHAAEHGTLNSLQILVANGADMFGRSSTGETVLHMAVNKYHMPLEKVEFLMERGVNVNLLDCSGTSPLHDAAFETSYKTVKFLVEHGAKIQCANDNGTTPLHNAVESTINRKQKVELLIKHGADVFAADKNGDTPLHVATDGGFELLELLIVDLNIDISNTDKQGNTLLYRAAMSSRDVKSKALLLLDKGADINATGKHGWSLIHWAICLGSGEDLAELLERGACASSIDEDGSSLLHKAVKSKTDALIKVQLLLMKGLSPNQLDGKGCTPLHIAAKEGLFQVMMFLHENGSDTSARNNDGRTILHEAAVSQIDTHKKVVSLVEDGVDVNALDNNNITPLHDIARQGPFETLEYIISQGANVTFTDNLGKTPLHLAASAGLGGVKKVGLLLDKGCSVNVEDYKGHTSMNDASVAGDTDCVKYLAERGATGRDEDAGGGLA